jgi:carbonic anhydrase
MRLFEAIVDANHRALSGDKPAGLHPAEFPEGLPVVALTCIDPRLNPLIPGVLGVREEHFIWLRNAGNIIFDPMSSMMRTLALACAVKGGKEIAIVGHTDCLVRKTTMLQLTERFRELGVDLSRLPENLNEFFGLFASERQNVIKAAEIVRQSPLIGPKVPVHGLLLDIADGRLEWLVNGYQTLGTVTAATPAALERSAPISGPLAELPLLAVGEMKFLESKIGEAHVTTQPAATPSPAEMAPSTLEPAAGPASELVRKAKSAVDSVQKVLRLEASQKYRIVGSDRKIYGPVTGGKIMEWIADGRIDWQTLAKPEGGAEWKPLSAWAASAAKDALSQLLPPKIQSFFKPKH